MNSLVRKIFLKQRVRWIRFRDSNMKNTLHNSLLAHLKVLKNQFSFNSSRPPVNPDRVRRRHFRTKVTHNTCLESYGNTEWQLPLL